MSSPASAVAPATPIAHGWEDYTTIKSLKLGSTASYGNYAVLVHPKDGFIYVRNERIKKTNTGASAIDKKVDSEKDLSNDWKVHIGIETEPGNFNAGWKIFAETVISHNILSMKVVGTATPSARKQITIYCNGEDKEELKRFLIDLEDKLLKAKINPDRADASIDCKAISEFISFRFELFAYDGKFNKSCIPPAPAGYVHEMHLDVAISILEKMKADPSKFDEYYKEALEASKHPSIKKVDQVILKKEITEIVNKVQQYVSAKVPIPWHNLGGAKDIFGFETLRLDEKTRLEASAVGASSVSTAAATSAVPAVTSAATAATPALSQPAMTPADAAAAAAAAANAQTDHLRLLTGQLLAQSGSGTAMTSTTVGPAASVTGGPVASTSTPLILTHASVPLQPLVAVAVASASSVSASTAPATPAASSQTKSGAESNASTVVLAEAPGPPKKKGPPDDEPPKKGGCCRIC